MSLRPREILQGLGAEGLSLAGAAIEHGLSEREQEQMQAATQVALQRWMEIGVLEAWSDEFIRCRQIAVRVTGEGGDLSRRGRLVANACAYAELVSYTSALPAEVAEVLRARWERAAEAGAHAGTPAGEVLEALLPEHPRTPILELVETAKACLVLVPPRPGSAREDLRGLL